MLTHFCILAKSSVLSSGFIAYGNRIWYQFFENCYINAAIKIKNEGLQRLTLGTSATVLEESFKGESLREGVLVLNRERKFTKVAATSGEEGSPCCMR